MVTNVVDAARIVKEAIMKIQTLISCNNANKRLLSDESLAPQLTSTGNGEGK